ncbi:MAG: hypothetical protein AABX38_06180 [Candidatus Micrarchaeota archaeon]
MEFEFAILAGKPAIFAIIGLFITFKITGRSTVAIVAGILFGLASFAF